MSSGPLSAIGVLALDFSDTAGRMTMLVRSTLYWTVRGRIEWRQTILQMLRIGVESFPVGAMTSLFTGMVLALQTGSSFKSLFNEPLFTGTIVSYAIVKELGPVMTALVVSGRAGAAVAAELGTMKVTEQLDALYTLGTDPVRYLVIPRVIAFVVMLPLLTVISNFSGVIGGCVVAYLKLGIPTKVYWDDVFNHLDNQQLLHGMIKPFVFAICIAFISCFKGIQTRGGAEGVGRSTTAAVVASMTAVLIVDYFLTAILVALGIT